MLIINKNTEKKIEISCKVWYNAVMDYARIKSYAKINLSLDITGTENGFHQLDSVVTTIDIFDLITAKKRKKDKLVTILMHGMGSESIGFEENNAVKAAEAFISKFDVCGVDLTIYKNIPMGAGLGGSSADVAGVLNCLAKLFEVDDEAEIKAIADSLGSDCGYMLHGGYARMNGRGDRVELLESNLKLNLVLLLPSTPVSTPKCYAMYDKLNNQNSNSTQDMLGAIEKNDLVGVGKALSNALINPAICLNEDVGKAIDELKDFDPLGVNMTGSGSCVYALFENEQFCSYAISRYKGKYKILQTKTFLPKRG
jgi:4-diphosphocytidyl-2-C-methyl-D-erythritol kinase